MSNSPIYLSKYEDAVRGIPIEKIVYVAMLEESASMVTKWWYKRV